MRKLFTILAFWGLVVGISAQGARADGFTAPATLSFSPIGMQGLFSLTFPGVNDFDWEFMGPQMFNSTGTFLPGPFAVTGGTGFPSPSGSFFFNMNTLAGGDITGGSVSGVTGAGGITYTVDFTYGSDAPVTSVSDPNSTFNFVFTVPLSGTVSQGFVDLNSIDVTSSSPTATPEPSSLLLLGSGFLALGAFARRRLIARCN
jgi:hypothetical protein